MSPNRNPTRIRQFHSSVRSVDQAVDQANDILNGSICPTITESLQIFPAILRCKLIPEHADRFKLAIIFRRKSLADSLKQHRYASFDEFIVSDL